ncbi:MAG: hypothetical protein LBR91_00755 [Puniceicoccales bacterium]|nr:hypothetical protein [Puniceicoccales bacterium]
MKFFHKKCPVENFAMNWRNYAKFSNRLKKTVKKLKNLVVDETLLHKVVWVASKPLA